MSDDARSRRALPAEVVGVWLLFAVVIIEIVVTYSRVPASELYHVSHAGLAGGLGRALVFLNFSTALAAIAVVLVLFQLLGGRLQRALGAVSIVLCAVVAWPGVVDQADLDPKLVNVLPTLGVAVAVVLTLLVARSCGVSRLRREGASWRITIAVLTLAVALPWLGAELGFYLEGVPLLGSLFLTGDLVSQPGMAGLHPAVHHGHHHGMDGALLVLTALLLVPTAAAVIGKLRFVLAALLALMFCYGVGNIANDAWLEQVVKRGWTSWQIPGVTVPHANGGWGVIVLAALVVWLVWRHSFAGDRGGASTPGRLTAPD